MRSLRGDFDDFRKVARGFFVVGLKKNGEKKFNYRSIEQPSRVEMHQQLGTEQNVETLAGDLIIKMCNEDKTFVLGL